MSQTTLIPPEPIRHKAAATVGPAEPAFRSPVHLYLSEICSGEILSMETSAAMIAFAPSLQAKFFLAEQAAEERRHALLLQRRMAELGLKPLPRSPAMTKVAHCFQGHIRNKAWLECLVAQNIVLEGVATVLFEALQHVVDRDTARLLDEINVEEQKHVRFGIQCLQKESRRAGFDALVLGTQDSVLSLMSEIFLAHRRVEEDRSIDYRAVGEATLENLYRNLRAIGVELSVWERAKRRVWQWLQ